MTAILLIAFLLTLAIAVWALAKWLHYKRWYHANDNWWGAMLSKTEESIRTWHSLYVTAMNACQDLDLQVSDLVYESQFKRDYQKEIADCKETIASQNIDIAKAQEDYYKLGDYLDKLIDNHTLTPICHSCKRRMRKGSVLVNGVYTCDWCKSKAAKAQSPADLTSVPFEGLEGVKEGDGVLFSDGVVRKVTAIDRTTSLPHAIKVIPLISDELCYFDINSGKHWDGKTLIHAIRIATKEDLKIYGGSHE